MTDKHYLIILTLAGVVWFLIRIFLGGIFDMPSAGDLFTYIMFIPLAEELFFRGVLQDYFKEKTAKKILGLTYANIIVSVLFASAHIPAWGLFHSALVFIPSLAFGFLYDKSGKLVYCIFLHAVYNFNVFIV